jgi:hypothetical protein
VIESRTEETEPQETDYILLLSAGKIIISVIV